MARIRTIKPDFWTDPALIECSLNARLLFIGLWNFADDAGNIEAHPVKIKASVFPMDNIKVEKYLIELETHDLIIPYSVNSRKYYNIRTFLKHQKIDHPSKPVCPDYDDSLRIQGELDEDSVSTQGGLAPDRKVLEGIKGKGKEGNSNAHFEKFWEAYPRKKSKGQAEKAFIKLNPSEQFLETIISKIEQAKTSEEWQKDGGKYIPYPATWLNAKGWEDEYSVDFSSKKEKPHVALPREKIPPEDQVNPEEIKKFKSNLSGIGSLKNLKVDIEEEGKNLKHEPTEAEILKKKQLKKQMEVLDV